MTANHEKKNSIQGCIDKAEFYERVGKCFSLARKCMRERDFHSEQLQVAISCISTQTRDCQDSLIWSLFFCLFEEIAEAKYPMPECFIALVVDIGGAHRSGKSVDAFLGRGDELFVKFGENRVKASQMQVYEYKKTVASTMHFFYKVMGETFEVAKEKTAEHMKCSVETVARDYREFVRVSRS